MVRPKVRIRSLMVLVAVIGLGIWGEQMRRRRAYCLRKAAEHRSQLISVSGFHFASAPYSPEAEEELRRTYPHAAWHLELSDAYRRCASHPWEATPSEPPEPSVFPVLPGQDPFP